MKNQILRPLAVSATLTLLLSSTAFADVTALQVWESWKSYAQSFGQNVQVGAQETNGDSLILRDVVISLVTPEANIRGSLDFIEFRERGDGTVIMTTAPDYPFSISADPVEGKPVDLAMIFRQSGMSIIASGNENDMAFEYDAPNLSAEVNKFIVDGKDTKSDIHFEISDVAGSFALASDGSTTYSSATSASTAVYKVAFTDPDSGDAVDFSGQFDGFRSESSSRIPADFDLENPNAVFGTDFATSGSFSIESSESHISLKDGSDELTVSSNSGGSDMNFAVGEGSIEYGASVRNANYVVQSAKIPFPEVALGFGEIAFNMLLPLAASDDPKDYHLAIKLGDFEISDMIWGMFDPASVMPRDPATVALDVSGQMKMLIDLTDPEQASNIGSDVPFEISNLDINDVEISAVGAAVTGQGGFTLDSTDFETFDGLPAPTGEINLQIVGANGLLDRLTQMGLLPEEQAGGMRMMLGLFARPADGEDTLTSQIEVSGDGSVFANGQQLK